MGYGYTQYTPAPHYSALREYEWLPDFLESQKIKSELSFLGQKKLELRKVLSAKQSLKKRLRESWLKYENRRLAKLGILLLRRAQSRDPFYKLEYGAGRDPETQRALISLQWGDVEKALDIAFAGIDQETLSDTKRAERLDELTSAIEQLEGKLKEHSPAGYFKIVDGQIAEDFRDVFVRHWRNVQGKCRSACGPQGIALEHSTSEERDAYERLGIASAISKNVSAPSPLPQSPFEEKERSWGM